jgi:oligopeptide transport system substrate-binding protein
MKKFMTSWLLLLFVVFLVACGGGDEKEEFTVTFNTNGGPAITALTVEEGSLATQPAAPSRDGYVFKGWFADAALTTPFSFALPVTGDLTVYAKWAQLFTVTYDANGGTLVGPATASVEQGTAAQQPASPTRDGYIFLGWATSAAGTTDYNFGSLVTANVTVYAKWFELAEDEFVVSFNAAGGSYVAPQNIVDGEVATEPADPTRYGYEFVGWFLGSAEYNFATPVTGNITLVAQWEAIPVHTVTFDSAGVIFTEEVLEGETVARPADPVRVGFIFGGWFVGETLYNFTTPVTADVTITAKWTALYYNATATLLNSIGKVQNMNPYSESLANASTMYTLVSDALYNGDYDWEAAIEAGIADEVGDFTNTDALPFNYFPAMAASRPIDVNNDGTVWRIELRQDLKFVDNTPIDAYTFEYGYKQLIDPKQLNVRASNLYSTDALPLVNAEGYFKQLTPDQDELGFNKYLVDDVEFTRENSYYGQTVGGYDIYHVENKYQTLTGPGGIKAYVEFWGSSYATYGLNGWVLETENDEYFRIGSDNKLYAPTTGWTLDGNPVPATTELPEGVTIKAGGPGYAGALPAYMDAEGNRAVTDEDGFPVDGEFTYEDAIPVTWEEVGFKVIDQYTFEFQLTSKKNQWQVMTQLSSPILSVVHPTNYEAGKIEDGARTTYGTHANPLVSFGVYRIIEWQPEGFFRLERNDWHYDAANYRIKYLRYDMIEDQSVAVNEFRQGRLDLVGVSGEYYEQYKNSEFLRLSPQSTFFRFAFSLDRGRDNDPSNDTPIMQYIEFREALYYATDRETFVTDVRAPGYPTHGILGPVYYSSEYNSFSYRTSEAGAALLNQYSPDTFGFNPVLAKQKFDEAYALAVADGVITDGDVVEIEFVFSNAETNIKMAEWLKPQWEAIFGSKFVLKNTPVTSAQLTTTGTGIWDTGNFDLTFGGWQGMTFWAPGMLQVYSDDWGADYILEVGFPTGNAELEVDLGQGKVAVTAWLAELNAKETLTSVEENYVDMFEDFLAGFEGDIYTGTYDNLGRDIYYVVLDYAEYEGRDVEFDRITAAMEGELLRQMINIPLFTTVAATMYNARVVLEAQAFHARMGWGGLKYMYIRDLS